MSEYNYNVGWNMDFQRMVVDIDALVDNDWAFDMDCKTLPKSKPYTQKEAREMAEVIGRVYLISHSPQCVCGVKYRIGKINKLVNKKPSRFLKRGKNSS